MSAPEPATAGTDLFALDRVAHWLDGLCADLQDAVAEVRRLAEQVGHDWSDARGREWVAQAELVHRDLGRQAALGTELGRAIGRIVEEAAGAGPDATNLADTPEASPVGPAGPRLGGTEGTRAEQGYGVRIAMLSDRPAAEIGPPR